MNIISIELPDASYNKMKEKAAELGFPLEELVKISVEDFLRHPDDQFKRIVDEILAENAELYRRLA